MSYNSSFKTVKNNLLKVYLNVKDVKRLLSTVKTVKVNIHYGMYDVTPSIIIGTKDNSVDITSFFGYKELSNHKHIAYKQADDWLGLDGIIIAKSSKFKRDLELVKCNNNWLIWVKYKFVQLFRRKDDT